MRKPSTVRRSLLGSAILLLTLNAAGCSAWTMVDEPNSRLLSSRVIESSDPGADERSWSFLDSLGHEIPLSVDCASASGESCWQSEDGSLSFSYDKSNRGPTSYRITADGSTVRAGCSTDHWASGARVCAPFPEQAEGFSENG